MLSHYLGVSTPQLAARGPPARYNPPSFDKAVAGAAADNGNAMKDLDRIVEAVLTHLSGLSGANVQAEPPGGVPEGNARTVSENCRVLRFGSQGFEGE